MTTIVNGERIETAEIEAEADRLRPQYESYVQGSPGSGPEQLAEWARENLIERALFRQAAREMNVELPQAEIDKAYENEKDHAGDTPEAELKADIELRMRVERLIAENNAKVPGPTEQELKDFYEEHKEEMIVPEQIRAGHIVKHVNADADKQAAFEAILEIKMKLDAGEAFEDLATEHSDCPDRAGDLGWFSRGQMVEEFEDVVFAMKAGEVSDIFLTQFGYHIARVDDRRAAKTLPFQEVRDRIAAELVEQKRGAAAEEFIDALKAKATIEDADDERDEDMQTEHDTPEGADLPGK